MGGVCVSALFFFVHQDNTLGGKDGWFVLDVWRHMFKRTFMAEDWIDPVVKAVSDDDHHQSTNEPAKPKTE